ncbi:MAG: hypothetical protein ACXVPU_06265 [Bacteroidia bacterium]
MKKLTFITLVVLLIVACKKEKTIEPKPRGVYWGDLTYLHGKVIRDSSTYQSYPVIETTNDCVDLKPRVNCYQSADLTQVGSKCDFHTEYKPYSIEICYLYNITTAMTGTFTSTRTMKIDTVSWNGIKLTKGTVKLNNDNSIDVEYTDSLLTGINKINHYDIHYDAM